MRVVIDTKVVISGTFFGGKPREILEAIVDGRVAAFATPEIADEYQGVVDEMISRKQGSLCDNQPKWQRTFGHTQGRVQASAWQVPGMTGARRCRSTLSRVLEVRPSKALQSRWGAVCRPACQRPLSAVGRGRSRAPLPPRVV